MQKHTKTYTNCSLKELYKPLKGYWPFHFDPALYNLKDLLHF